MSIQSFGTNFDLPSLLRARQVARDMTYELATLIHPGMQEDDAHSLYKELSRKHEVERQWHPAKIRFGPNTLKSFRDPSDPYVLKKEDLFFIDIGPVIAGHEADYGETFSLGEIYEHKKIIEASKSIFNEVAHYWKTNRTSGALLYDFAKKKASTCGHQLSVNSDGHRIGDFPHHIFFKGGLPECLETIIPNAWILEIHLWNSDNTFGAFFEDLLTDHEI